MFGLEITETTSGHSKIFVNPGYLVIPNSDDFEVKGFVIAKDEFTADLVGLGSNAQGDHITLTAQRAFVRLNQRLKKRRQSRRSDGAPGSPLLESRQGSTSPLAGVLPGTTHNNTNGAAAPAAPSSAPPSVRHVFALSSLGLRVLLTGVCRCFRLRFHSKSCA